MRDILRARQRTTTYESVKNVLLTTGCGARLIDRRFSKGWVAFTKVDIDRETIIGRLRKSNRLLTIRSRGGFDC